MIGFQATGTVKTFKKNGQKRKGEAYQLVFHPLCNRNKSNICFDRQISSHPLWDRTKQNIFSSMSQIEIFSVVEILP